MVKRVAHDWMKSWPYSQDERICKRCGLFETEHERNLSASQSTDLYVTYWKDGKSYGRTDPGCCERE